MESTPKKAPRSKFPALLVVALALVALVFVIWRVDSAPSTNDAYASADTIDVVPEVSGRIVELAVTDNQAVKQGDLLFRIDPRPYEANLAKAEASLAALDKQIGVADHKRDVVDALLVHIVYGVAASTTHTDHLDDAVLLDIDLYHPAISPARSHRNPGKRRQTRTGRRSSRHSPDPHHPPGKPARPRAQPAAGPQQPLLPTHGASQDQRSGIAWTG